ncbi:MAG: methyltransferase domain-containing protein [Candidatus Magasanikbacteria bacterium]
MEYFCKKIYTRAGIIKENPFPEKKVLHLGCGDNKLKGAFGVDTLDFSSVDMQADLDVFPWGIDDNSFDIIFIHSALEHFSDLVRVFCELERIGKVGCRIIIAVPYFRSVDAFADPTHKHFFTSTSMNYFVDQNNSQSGYQYINKKLSLVGFWYGWPHSSKNLFIRLFKTFVQRSPKFYDQYLSLLFPVKILIWELEVKE